MGSIVFWMTFNVRYFAYVLMAGAGTLLVGGCFFLKVIIEHKNRTPYAPQVDPKEVLALVSKSQTLGAEGSAIFGQIFS